MNLYEVAVESVVFKRSAEDFFVLISQRAIFNNTITLALNSNST